MKDLHREVQRNREKPEEQRKTLSFLCISVLFSVPLYPSIF